MPEHTPIFDWPFPKVDNSEEPAGPAQIHAALSAIEATLETIQFLTGYKEAPAAPAPGQIIVVNGTSDPVYKALTGDIAVNSAGVTSIGNGKVLEAMLGPESVATAKIKNLAITAAKLAAEAVETSKLAGLGVTTAKIAELAITAQKLASEAVETGKIKNAAVTTAKIASEAITEALIADGAVSSRKWKPTRGQTKATGALELGLGGYANVPGLLFSLTPTVKSVLSIDAIFNVNINGSAAVGASASATISVNLVAEENWVASIGEGDSTEAHLALHIGQHYDLELEAGKFYAIRGVGKLNSAGAGSRIEQFGTALNWILMAA